MIYKNNNGIFSQIHPGDLIGMQRGDIDCADYDNDGDLDILMTGLTNGSMEKITKLYENIGNGFVENPLFNVAQVSNPTVDWADYDNDGDQDFLLTGVLYSGDRISILYNNENGVFLEDDNIILTPVINGACDWGDFDGDGDLDILLTGYSNGSCITKIYENLGNGFVETYMGDLPGICSGCVQWGDYDNDGDLDILLTGGDISNLGTTEIYTNTDNGFELLANENIIGTVVGSCEWGDYDNDGDLDILITGSADDTCVTRIYKNNISIQNTQPQAPENLGHLVVNDVEILLNWDKAIDNETPSDGLSYNLWIGAESDYQDIKSPESDMGSGFSKNIKTGNVGQNDSWLIKGLPPGDYYWGVQTIDNSFSGSGFSVVDTFIVPGYLVTVGLEHPLGGSVTGCGTYLEGQNCTLTANINDLFQFVSWTESDTLVSVDPSISFSVSHDRSFTANFSTDHFIDALPNELEGLSDCDVEWGDYDNDGDLDILLSGSTSYAAVSKIYNNTGNGFLEVFPNLLVPVYHSNVDWVDFDNDNDLDIFVSGVQTANDPVSKLYENTGNSFVEVFDGVLPGIISGGSDWGDFDNDGDMDLFLTGSNIYPLDITGIYENTGDGFVEYTAFEFPKIDGSNVRWGDYDNDGDLDLILCGYYNSDYFTRIYENDNYIFNEVIIADLSHISNPAIDWGDYDNDGDLDIIVTGFKYFGIYQFHGPTSEIYENTGEGFVRAYEYDIYPVYGGDAAWGDYDNDGDLDLIVAGSNNSSQFGWTKLYENTGNGFIESHIGEFIDLGSGSMDWGDYDNDGDLDVLIAGWNEDDGRFTTVYQNNTASINTDPTPPQNLQFSNSQGNLNLSWDASFDQETPQEALSYNIHIGTTPGGSDFKSAEAITSTGKGLTTDMGNVQQNIQWDIATIDAGTYYWSVQALDKSFSRSGFSEEASFVLENSYATILIIESPINSGITTGSGSYAIGDWVSLIAYQEGYWSFSHWSENEEIVSANSGYGFVMEGPRILTANFVKQFTPVFEEDIIAVSSSSADWGDFDLDGDLDLLICGNTESGPVTKLYENQFDSFVEYNQIVFPGLFYGTVEWGDLDNDGDLDILLLGTDDDNSGKSYLYENVTSGFNQINSGDLENVYYSSADWGDFDNDGDLDIVLIGKDNNNPYSKIYENTGDGFTEIYPGSLLPIYHGDVDWGDYDNDGDLDIVMTGSDPGLNSLIYENNGFGFQEVFVGALQNMDYGSADWADFDSDGDLDILLTGYGFANIYENIGNGFEEVYEGDIMGFDYSSADWGDFDNDGDLDIVICGWASYGTRTRIYENTGSGFESVSEINLPHVQNGTVVWGDYDNDGDLDIFITGAGSNGGTSAIMRNNLTDNPNSIPATPQNLQGVLTDTGIFFSWDKSFDDETPQNGLLYNLRIGITPGGSEIKSPMTLDTQGLRSVNDLGNAMLNNYWNLEINGFDTVFWSVQAIDNCFAGSVFAPENIITMIDTFQVILYAFPTIGGATYGTGYYIEGDTCHAIPFPATNYGFLNWTENDIIVSEDSVYSFPVIMDRELTANFELITGEGNKHSPNGIVVSPNPCKDKVNIRVNMIGEEYLLVHLLDVNLNNLIYFETTVEDGFVEIGMDGFSNGMYFLIIENRDGEIINVTKLIKIE
ncbi:MAG: hypothetical protein DRJ05_07550 [Bacteroidetes bacterium]|nr:MAG: hypothetical protein DRJ05_07550 [Bacteroidota bacterium]